VSAKITRTSTSSRSATIKAREGAFEGTGGGNEVPVEEADDDFMPIHGDDETPLDYGDDDHDEDGRQGIAATSGRQGRAAITSFDERFTDLMGFKQKFGHCNVPRTKSGEYKSLGEWCSNLRKAYKKIQKRETPNIILTQENIQQLDDAGFKWNVSISTSMTFDERYAELIKFKEKAGHCNVPQTKSDGYQSLGRWCSKLRVSYKKIQKSEIPNRKLTQEMTHQLDDAGFNWSVSTCRTFEERYAELMKYKLKVGHCNVPQTKK